MKKRSFSAVFLAALIISGLIFIAFANFSAAESGSTLYIISGYVHGSSGNLVSGAYTYLVNSTGSSFNSGRWADSSGFYYMSAPAGTYRLVVKGPVGSGTSYSEANIELNSDITKNVTLVQGFKISGYILDSSGNHIAGASTNIYNSSWSVPAVTTDSSGYYEVYAPAGTYTFIIWPPQNSNKINYEDKAFTVSSDMTKDITLVSGFKVSGYIRFPSGEAVTGVSTSLTHANGTAYSSGHWSDSLGHYNLAAPAGTYRLRVWGLSGTTTSYAESNIELNSDITKNVVITTVSILPTSATLDVGQAKLFNATPTGGSGTYTIYEWRVNGSIKSAQSSPTFSFTPATAGTYVVTAIITDSEGATSARSTVVSVRVNSALVAPNVSASKTMIDQSQTTVLSATTVTTGTSPYAYRWYSKAPGESSYSLINGANSLSYSFVTSSSTVVGVWSFVLNVTDTASTSVTVSSAEALVTVNPPPTVTVSPSAAILDDGSSKTFTAVASGGSGSLSYQWFLDNDEVGDNSASYTYTATIDAHTIYVKVTDSASPPLHATSDIVPVTVNPALVAPDASASKDIIDQGQTATLTSTAASAGTPPYTYQWVAKAPNGSVSPISGATSSAYDFVTSNTTAVGVWTFVLDVTDSASTPVTVTSPEVFITVNAAPTATVSPRPAALNVGQTKVFTATPSNGSGAYTGYQWYVNGAAQEDQIGSTFNYSFASAGSYSITATVTDSLGVTSAQSPASIVTVNLALAAPILNCNNNIVSQGQTSTFVVAITTGTPTYTYNWYSKAPSDSSYSTINGATSGTYSFTTSLSTAVGVWSFKVQVTDATGAVADSAEVSVKVNPALTVSVTPGTVTLDVGQSQLFTATPSGGSGIYTTYQWFVNGSAQQGTGATFSYSPSTAGTHLITATVTDNSGATSQRSTSVTATATTTPTPTPTASTTTPTPTLTSTPTSTTPIATSTPTVTITPTSSALPSATANTQQGTNIGTYIGAAIAVVSIVVVAAAAFMFIKRGHVTKK